MFSVHIHYKIYDLNKGTQLRNICNVYSNKSQYVFVLVIKKVSNKYCEIILYSLIIIYSSRTSSWDQNVTRELNPSILNQHDPEQRSRLSAGSIVHQGKNIQNLVMIFKIL